jgi:hypothetical protein
VGETERGRRKREPVGEPLVGVDGNVGPVGHGLASARPRGV